MTDLLRLGFTVLVYPGLLFVALLVTGTGRVVGGSTRGRALRGLWRAGRGVGNYAYALAALGVLLALVWLPWPAAPWQLRWSTTAWWIWVLMEISVVAMLLPLLVAPAPEVSRAAVREAQLGVSGRLPIWIVMAVMFGAADIALSAAWVVSLLAVVLVLPAAAGWAPFGPRSSDLRRASRAEWVPDGRGTGSGSMDTPAPWHLLVSPRQHGVRAATGSEVVARASAAAGDYPGAGINRAWLAWAADPSLVAGGIALVLVGRAALRDRGHSPAGQIMG